MFNCTTLRGMFHCLSLSASGVVFTEVIHTLCISNEQMIHKLYIIKGSMERQCLMTAASIKAA